MSTQKPKKPVEDRGRKFYDFAGRRCQCACLKELWDQMEVVDALANKCTEYAESYISDEEKKEDDVFVYAQQNWIEKWMEEIERYNKLLAGTLVKRHIVIRWHRRGKSHKKTVELSLRRAYLIGRFFGMFGRMPTISFHCAECGREVPKLNYEPWDFKNKGRWSTATSWVKRILQKECSRCLI